MGPSYGPLLFVGGSEGTQQIIFPHVFGPVFWKAKEIRRRLLAGGPGGQLDAAARFSKESSHVPITFPCKDSHHPKGDEFVGIPSGNICLSN